MAKAQKRKLACLVSGAERDGTSLRVRYAPVRGQPAEIEDRIVFAPAGEVRTVESVGRFLRILRAGRVRAPADPYGLHDDLDTAADLVQRCRGAAVWVSVRQRFDRVLSVWTEAGVERISGVLDFREEADALAVRRRGGHSVLRIPRASLIRYESSTRERLEVTSIDIFA